MPSQTSSEAQTPPQPPTAAETGTMDLVRFAYAYGRPQLRTILFSALFMTGCTVFSVSVPALAQEIISYGTAITTTAAATVSSVVQASNSTGAEASFKSAKEGSGFLLALGPLSEQLVKPILPLFLPFLRMFYVSDSSDDAAALAWPSPYVEGILCRCVLMGLSVMCYHFTSLIAHLAAYQAGMAAQSALVQDCVHRILHTEYPERVAVVNAVKLAQIITASGRALSDMMGELLTNVLSQVMYVIGFFFVMLFISYQLTLTILLGVVVVQGLFFFEGRALHRQGSKVTEEESGVQAFIANILQRSETVFVFQCRPFVLGRMRERLARVQHLTSGLNRSIHGYAALSTGFTRLILVLALGLSNYYQQKGHLDVSRTVLYFACFQSFVSTLASLSAGVRKTRAALGRLQTLSEMLRWYSEPAPLYMKEACKGSAVSAGSEGQACVDVQEAHDAPVALEKVSFAYPAVPAFFSEGSTEGSAAAVAVMEDSLNASTGARHNNGVKDVSFTAAVGGITALYGPSGSGKSTCLRMLCGLVRPHAGTVHTQRRAVLLEQQHAIFIGTVAENILLTDLRDLGSGGAASTHLNVSATASTKEGVADVQKRVLEAAVKSGCSSFLSNPFSTLIESIDHPQFSGGQLQRIALARIFAQSDGYSLVLLDEPTSGLDKAAVGVLLETLKELRDVHGKTVLVSTHDHRVAEVADKVVELSRRAPDS